jgi:hypothetical protein
MPTAYKNRPFPLPHFPFFFFHREVGKGKTCEILVGAARQRAAVEVLHFLFLFSIGRRREK